MHFQNLLSRFNLVILLITATGCSTVQPWERGDLAKPQMTLTANPQLGGLVSHVYGSREAAIPASGSASGGGCGCY